jgi:hypothetical protein
VDEAQNRVELVAVVEEEAIAKCPSHIDALGLSRLPRTSKDEQGSTTVRRQTTPSVTPSRCAISRAMTSFALTSAPEMNDWTAEVFHGSDDCVLELRRDFNHVLRKVGE